MKKTTLIFITLLFLFPYFGNAQYHIGFSFDTPLQFNDNQLDLGTGGSFILRYKLKNNMIIQFEKGFYKKNREQSSLVNTSIFRLGYDFHINKKQTKLSFPSYIHTGTYRNLAPSNGLFWGLNTGAFYHINKTVAIFGEIRQSFNIKINNTIQFQSRNFSYISVGFAINPSNVFPFRKK